MRFCLATVRGLKEEEEVTESVENSLFGSILHRVMEDIYKPMHGATIEAAWLDDVIRDDVKLMKKVDSAFAKLFFHTPDDVRPLSGQNSLTGEVIAKYVRQILRRDMALAPFRYVDSELRITSAIPLTDGRLVNLKGFIDRLDEVGHSLRIVDYKTGSKKALVFETPAELFDRANKARPSAIMQVCLYAWMLHAEGCSLPLRPAICYVRSLFADDFDPSIYVGKKGGRKDSKTLLDDFVGQHLADFESSLRGVLDEMFDPRLPFLQTDMTDRCKYCPFRDICGR